MKVVATSDLHGNLPEVPECDLLIVAGDVCPVDNHDLDHQLEWLENEFANWLHFAPAKKIVGIAGNHDFIFEKAPDSVNALFLRWTYLKGTAIEWQGLTIFGSPYVPNLPNWAFYMQDHKFAKHWELIPKDVDILVTHGPPYGYGDVVGPIFGGPKNVGERHLRHRLHHLKPKVHFFGHIHEGYGHYRHDTVEEGLYNVAFVDETYAPVNDLVEIELDRA